MAEPTREHQSVRNGRELPADQGEFHELRDQRIRCTCRRSTVARFYFGHDDATAELAAWIWLPAYVTAGGVKVPPKATTIPQHAGETGWTEIAQCSRCRNTWLAFPGGIPQQLIDLPNGAVGHPVVIAARNAPADEPWMPGDEYMAGKLTGEHISGIGPTVLVRLESPDWGIATSDTPRHSSD